MTKRVAVVGASNDRRKYGNKAVRAFLHQGHDVFPVNPHEAEIEGLRAYRSVTEISGPLDLITVYVPPEVGLRLVDGFAAKGATELWLNPGSESDALVERARARGLEPILACSIMGIGESPSTY